MDILIFIYNIFLIVLYTVVLTFCIINYRHKKRPLTAATAVLFLFYIFDNIIIYMTEFLDGFSVRYDLQFMSAPAFKTLIFLVTSFCLVSIQHQVLSRRPKNRDTAALVLLGLSLLFIPTAGYGAFKVWLYYLPAQLFTLYLSVSGLLYLNMHPGELDREMHAYKSLLWITAVFSLLILAEDTIVIFSFDVYSDIMVKINNRSLSEDMMSILYSVYALAYLTRQLQGPLIKIQAPDMSGSTAPAADTGRTAMMEDGAQVMTEDGTQVMTKDGAPTSTLPDGRTQGQADSKGQIQPDGPDSNTVFLHFASHYQLTSREQDILRILLTDKNNQEISDALFISIGTVKTHVHNIFQKVNVTKRSQLLRVYFEYQKDMPWK